MNGRGLTPVDLLSLWERGEGQLPTRRALALLGDRGQAFASAPVGRRDAALLALRVECFGSAFTGVTRCPACREEIELAFDADEVWREPGAIAGDGFRLPTSEDLAAIEAMDDVEAARQVLLDRCAPDADAAVLARMAAADPQADVQVDADCPACGHRWREPFDILTFVWTEIATRAHHLLGDVHELALAYGWSERDILALSPPRRQAYLEMIR